MSTSLTSRLSRLRLESKTARGATRSRETCDHRCRTMTSRDTLHRLIDDLSEADVALAERLLRALAAPLDDEPDDDDFDGGLTAARAELARGEGIPHAPCGTPLSPRLPRGFARAAARPGVPLGPRFLPAAARRRTTREAELVVFCRAFFPGSPARGTGMARLRGHRSCRPQHRKKHPPATASHPPSRDQPTNAGMPGPQGCPRCARRLRRP